jgi:hypothetical protein
MDMMGNRIRIMAITARNTFTTVLRSILWYWLAMPKIPPVRKSVSQINENSMKKLSVGINERTFKSKLLILGPPRKLPYLPTKRKTGKKHSTRMIPKIARNQYCLEYLIMRIP